MFDSGNKCRLDDDPAPPPTPHFRVSFISPDTDRSPGLAALRLRRKELERRIEALSSSGARVQELGDKGLHGGTEQTLVALYRELGEVGALIQRAVRNGKGTAP
ncbi:MAG TPA: hypothetical protein VGC35_00470 [Allosphingosinicella sp.]